MVLTASQGSVKYSDIVRAVRNVFPSGKSSKTAKTKDIFIADEDEVAIPNPEDADSDREPLGDGNDYLEGPGV